MKTRVQQSAPLPNGGSGVGQNSRAFCQPVDRRWEAPGSVPDPCSRIKVEKLKRKAVEVNLQLSQVHTWHIHLIPRTHQHHTHTRGGVEKGKNPIWRGKHKKTINFIKSETKWLLCVRKENEKFEESGRQEISVTFLGFFPCSLSIVSTP